MCAALAMSVKGEASVSVPYLSRFTGISGVTLFLGASGVSGAPLAMGLQLLLLVSWVSLVSLVPLLSWVLLVFRFHSCNGC